MVYFCAQNRLTHTVFFGTSFQVTWFFKERLHVMRISNVAPILAVVAIIGLNGCGKIPTWSELMGEKKAEVATPTPPPTPPALPPVAPVAPPPPSADEVIAQFKAMKPAQITDNVIQKLTGLSEGLDQITEINADGSPLTKSAFTEIEKLKNLRQLRISGTVVNDEACQNIGKVSSLEVLAMSGTPVTDVGIAALSELSNLNTLELESCHVTSNGFDAIGKLPSLVSINLRLTPLDNRGLNDVCHNKSMKYLNLSNTGIDDYGLEALKKLDGLEVLILAGDRTNGAGLKFVQKSAKTLKTLSVNRCNIGEDGFKAISQFKALEHLDLGDIQLINDIAVNNIVKGMKNLKRLNLSKAKLFTGAGLEGLKNCKEFEELYIDQCSGVGDRPAVAILKSLKSLKRVRLGGTSISATGVQELRSNNGELEIN